MKEQSFLYQKILHVGIALLLFHSVPEVQSFTRSVVPKSFFRNNVSTFATTTSAAVSSIEKGTTTWEYNGHYVYTQVQDPDSNNDDDDSKQQQRQQRRPDVLLIHGFGCSTTYWRATAAALVKSGYRVHALDLLGQGKSAKPGRSRGVEYSIDLWADLVDTYAREHIDPERELVLAGNSLGSLVALSALTGDFSASNDDAAYLRHQHKNVKGVCMFNCGVGLNSRGIANEPKWNPLQKWTINNLYGVLTLLIFNNRPLLSYVLNEVVTKDLLRDTLRSLYVTNPDRVDDELVDSFFLPAQDDGSVEALSQIYCNEPGRTPFDLHEKHGAFLKSSDGSGGVPIHLVWGDNDAVTPLDGGVGQFYVSLASEEDSNVSFQKVKSGHVPFDDNPSDSNESMLQWLENTIVPGLNA